MPSTIASFPVDQFLDCVRNNRNNLNKFVSQANSLNIEWTYEIIKHCYNMILQKKQLPSTKLNALLVIRDLMQTYQIPCYNLIQAYILPIVYEIAIEKPQQKGDKRGSNFFQQLNKNNKIPNIEQTGIKFLALCSQILYAGSIIKTKRIFQNQQMKQKSEFVDQLEKYKKYEISGTPSAPQQLQNFNKQFIERGRQIYVRNLKNFGNSKNNYGEYFVSKILDSLRSDSNPLFNNVNQVSSLSNDLDMRKLLKKGDTLITTPLIEEMLTSLKTQQNFMIKKNYIALLTDFVKWGDAQAIAKICYDDNYQSIAKQIAKVEGQNGFEEGEKIYPKVKGQRDGKKKFYLEYLKSLQVISKCLNNQNVAIEQSHRIKDAYSFLKKQKKFQFPQNLLAKKIQQDFHQNLQYNEQRNMQVMKRLRQSASSIDKRNKKGSIQSKPNSVSVLNKQIEQIIDQLLGLCENEQNVPEKMGRLLKFNNQFQNEIQNLNNDHLSMGSEDIQEMYQNGNLIRNLIQKVQIQFIKLRNKNISFAEFKKKHNTITKDLVLLQESAKNSICSDKQMPVHNIRMSKQSIQQVNSSYKPEKAKHHASTVPAFTHKNQYQDEKAEGVYSLSQQGNFRKIHKITANSLGAQNVKQKTSQVHENNQIPHIVVTSQAKNNSMLHNKNYIHQRQEDILKHVTSSILSKKNQSALHSNLNQLREDPNIQQMQNKIRSSINEKLQSGRSSLMERAEAKKKQKEIQSKIQSQAVSIMSQKNRIKQNQAMPIAEQRNNQNSFQLNASNKNQSKLSNGESVEYVDYVSPPSFRVPKNQTTNERNAFNKTEGARTVMNDGIPQLSATLPNGIPLNNATNFKQVSQAIAPIIKQISNPSARLQISSKDNASLHNNQQIKASFPTSFNNYGQRAVKTQQFEKASPEFQRKIEDKFNDIFSRTEANKKVQSNQSSSQKNSQSKTSSRPILTSNGYFGYNAERPPEYVSSQQKQRQMKIYNMYKTQLTAYNHIIYVNQDQNQVNLQYENNKENPFNNSMPNQLKMRHNQYADTIQQKNINREQFRNSKESSVRVSSLSNSEHSQRNVDYSKNNQMGYGPSSPFNQNNQQNIFRNYNQNRQQMGNYWTGPKYNSPSSIINNYGRQQKYQFIADQDVIKEPEFQPLQNSYYGAEEVYANIINSDKPQFKKCFQIGKQFLPSPIKSRVNANYNDYQYKNAAESNMKSISSSRSTHQQYLIAKIRRQYQRQKDSQTKSLQNRILQLKSDTSRLKNQAIFQSNERKSNSSRSNYENQSKVERFSSDRSWHNSPVSLKPSRLSRQQLQNSKISAISAPGVQIYQNQFDHYLSGLNETKIKRMCLKNKSLILSTETCQIGYMFNQSLDLTKMIVYFTPHYNIQNFSYSISRQPNLDIDHSYRGYSEIAENKQIKIQITARNINIPFSLPLMNVSFRKGSQNKNHSFYLPLSFNKFVNLNPVDSRFEKEFLADSRKIVRTSQFTLNPKLLKSKQIIEYFPNLSMLSKDLQQKSVKYGASWRVKNSKFSLLLTTKKRQRMVIQGLAQNQSDELNLQFFMLTLKKLLQN